MNYHVSNDSFKKIIIVFWMLWWLIALWTDVVGALAHWGLLNKSWAPDMNYPALFNSLQMYNAPVWLVNFLFFSIIAWSFVATITFVYACMGLTRNRTVWMKRAQLAFIVSITFWLAFFLSDQIVMKFDFEENHMVQGGFLLLSYFGLYLLPDK